MGFFKPKYYGTSNIVKSRAVISKIGDTIRRNMKEVKEEAPRKPHLSRKRQHKRRWVYRGIHW